MQRHIADGKRILKSVFLAALHGNQLIAVAGKLTQNTDIQVWDETAFYKANAKQIPDPLGIFRIIFVSLYSPYPCTTRMPRFSRMLNTGTQYFPVDSMQTSKQLCSNSQSAKRFKSELKVLNRFFW